MSTKAKNGEIPVYLWKTGHQSQPWKFAIDDHGPGPLLQFSERYSTRQSAKRGARRRVARLGLKGSAVFYSAKPPRSSKPAKR